MLCQCSKGESKDKIHHYVLTKVLTKGYLEITVKSLLSAWFYLISDGTFTSVYWVELPGSLFSAIMDVLQSPRPEVLPNLFDGVNACCQ